MTESANVAQLLAVKPAAIRELVSRVRQLLDDDAADVYCTDTDGGDIRHHFPRNTTRRFMYSEMRFPPSDDCIELRLTVGDDAEDDGPFENLHTQPGRIKARLEVNAAVPVNAGKWVEKAKEFRRNGG